MSIVQAVLKVFSLQSEAAPAPSTLREIAPADLELVHGGLPHGTWGVAQDQLVSSDTTALPHGTW